MCGEIGMLENDDNAGQQGGFLKRIPADVRATFTEAQIAAVERAYASGRHGVDIRFSVPLPGGRYYVVILGGREKRSDERRRLERKRHPVWTALNVVTIASFVVMLFFFAVGLVYMLA